MDQERMTVCAELEQEKAECLAAVVSATGWTEAEALEKIEDCRARIGISYSDYQKMKMYRQPIEKQARHYRNALSRRKAQKVALQKCVNAVADATGWTETVAENNILSSMKALNIQYADYVKMQLFRVPLEKQAEFCQNFEKNNPAIMEPTVPARPTGETKRHLHTPRAILKSEVCAALEIPFDGEEERYSCLSAATEKIPGALVYLPAKTSIKHSDGTPYTITELAKWAIANGAKKIICKDPIEGVPCLAVDTSIALTIRKILKFKREQLDFKGIIVTGSYGKTTTMLMLEAALGSILNTYGSKGMNLNATPAAAYRVQRVDESTELFLQEASEAPDLGIPGFMSDFIAPDLAIVTSIGTAHIEFTKSRNNVVRSCLSVQRGMPKDGKLILNGDDSLLCAAKTTVPTVYYGIKNQNADFRAVNITNAQNGIHFDVMHEGELTPVELHCVGLHNVSNALAVFAAGVLLGLDKKVVAEGLSLYRSEGIRQNLFSHAGYHFYLDCYNASIESMRSALQTLSSFEMNSRGRRIAVLADIKAAGAHAQKYHRAVGEAVRRSKVDILICYGNDSNYIAEEAAKKQDLLICRASSHASIARLLRSLATPDDIILLKGSHDMHLERVPDLVLGTQFYEPESAPHREANRYFIYYFYEDHAMVAKASRTESAFWIPDYPGMHPVTEIGKSAFEDAQAEMVVLPSVLVSIRKAAFRNMKNLRSIVFPAALKRIENDAFAGCSSLEKVALKEDCLYIGHGAFRDCINLRRVSLTAGVAEIEDDAFVGCEELEFECPRGSYAESWARRNHYRVVTM